MLKRPTWKTDRYLLLPNARRYGYQRRQLRAAPWPVGAENSVNSCDLRVFVDQAAEPIPPKDPGACAESRWMHAPGGRVLPQRPVRPVAVVVIGVLAEDQPLVPLAGDQHPVRAFAADAADPPFGDRVCARRCSACRRGSATTARSSPSRWWRRSTLPGRGSPRGHRPRGRSVRGSSPCRNSCRP